MEVYELPKSVRYVKNGDGGKWWEAALRDNRIYCGWDDVPNNAIEQKDWAAMKAAIDEYFRIRSGDKGAATRDFKALETLLDHPSQHLWVTIQGQHLWWCTVEDQAEAGPLSTRELGHFWLRCSRPWSNHSIGRKRELLLAKLPGSIGVSAGFRATVCKPGKHESIRRIVANEQDEEAQRAEAARELYQAQLAKMLDRLHWKDFELLIDLILARGGWARIERRGANKQFVDIEAENVVTGEMLIVQVKSQASQVDVDEFAGKVAPDGNVKMFFACHQPKGVLMPPVDSPRAIKIWQASEIARRAVAAGLGEWIEQRF